MASHSKHFSQSIYKNVTFFSKSFESLNSDGLYFVYKTFIISVMPKF